ncbi:MAG TPA: hypothetical protein VFV02_17425, partial [Acidimicrobiales bacterium]|nr:hypothetical protein [Acidimicrobiales bacterium]
AGPKFVVEGIEGGTWPDEVRGVGAVGAVVVVDWALGVDELQAAANSTVTAMTQKAIPFLIGNILARRQATTSAR